MKRRKWIVFVLCWLGMVTYFTERWVFGPMIPYLMADFNIDRVLAGILGSAQFIGFLLMPLVAGFLSDRVGRKYVILSGLFGLSFFTVLSGFTHFYHQMYATRFLTGMCEPFFSVPVMVLMVELFPSHPGFFITLISSGTSLGWFAGPILSGGLLEASGNWRYAFWLSGSVGLVLCCLLTFFWRGISTEKDALDARMKSQFRFRDTLFVLLILMALLSFFDAIAEFGFSMWLPSFLQEEKGFPILQAGIITSMWGLGQTFGRPVLGLVGDRIGYRRVGTPAAFIMALSFYCIVTSQAYGSFVFWQLTAGFIGAGVMGSLWPFTAVLFGKLKGTALGLLSNVAQLGAAAAPILCGYVGERVSLGKGLLLISVIPSAMVGLLFLMSYFWVRADLPQDLRGCFAESPG